LFFIFYFIQEIKSLEKVFRKKILKNTGNVYCEITRIQQDSVLIKFRKFRRSDCHKRNPIFPVAVKGRVGERFSLILPEKTRVAENYVINLVAGTFTI